jgi:hypothetical protein
MARRMGMSNEMCKGPVGYPFCRVGQIGSRDCPGFCRGQSQPQLAEAERDDKRAYVRATKDGWSTDELKKLGLENAAAGRRRTTNRKEGENTPAAPDNDPMDNR